MAEIRAVTNADLPAIHQLNEAALPHVNGIPITEFEVFMKICSFFL